MEAHNLPPVPEPIGKPQKPEGSSNDDDVIELTDADIEEIEDLTSEAEDVSEHGSPEVRENMLEIQRIEEERVGEKETLRAAHEALKLSEETGKLLAERKESERLDKLAKARQELMDVGIIPKNPDEAFKAHVAERLADAKGEPAPRPSVEDQEKKALASVKETREAGISQKLLVDALRKAGYAGQIPYAPPGQEKQTEVMLLALAKDFHGQAEKRLEETEQSIKEKYGVDVVAQSGKGLLGRIGLGFRSMTNRNLRGVLEAYRGNLDRLNALGVQIDDAGMTPEERTARANRATLRTKPASPGTGGNIGHGHPRN